MARGALGWREMTIGWKMYVQIGSWAVRTDRNATKAELCYTVHSS